ncbi:MAG: hypothetical protein ACJ746_19500 [Bryobacteraceae bacterium]
MCRKQYFERNWKDLRIRWQKTFAGLMLGYAAEDAIEMKGVAREFGISLTAVADNARTVLAPGADTSPHR